MSLALADNQIVVTCEDTVFINRRIEGNFPNYKQLLPDGYATRATIEVDKLVASVRRASLLGSTSSPVRFDLNNASQTVQISAASQDVGSAQEIISCAIEGEDVEIAFNYAYVLDGLGSIATDEVYLEVQSALKPGIFPRARAGKLPLPRHARAHLLNDPAYRKPLFAEFPQLRGCGSKRAWGYHRTCGGERCRQNEPHRGHPAAYGAHVVPTWYGRSADSPR